MRSPNLPAQLEDAVYLTSQRSLSFSSLGQPQTAPDRWSAVVLEWKGDGQLRYGASPFEAGHDMTEATSPIVERSIARCRAALSAAALVAVFIDPTEPFVTRWIQQRSGNFAIDPYALAVMGAHLCYSLVLVYVHGGQIVSSKRLAQTTTWIDFLFGAVIAALSEGVASPFYAYVAFAGFETGVRSGLR